MKRTADFEDNVYLRVNKDLSDLFHSFNDDGGGVEDELMPLGFKPGSSHAEIPAIRRMPMPREDGYMDNTADLRTVDERPFGRQYFDKELERERIMEQNEDYRFVVLLAGAMNKSPIDLYREEDLEKVLRERETDRLRIRHELQRTIVPFAEKTRQRTELEARKRVIEQDQAVFVNDSYDRLVNLGRYLLDGTLLTGVASPQRYGLARLELTRLDLDILLGRAPVDSAEAVASRELTVVSQYTDGVNEATQVDLDQAKISFPSADDQRRAAFIAVSLFRYFLDNESAYSTIRRVVRANACVVDTLTEPLSVILDTIDLPEYLRNNLPTIAESDMDDAGTIDLPVGDVVNGISWNRLRGTHTVDMSALASFYAPASIKQMEERGLRDKYGELKIQNHSYTEIMQHFLYASNPDYTILNRINLINDQPASVKTVLGVFLQSELMDLTLLKILLKSHFIWCYFYTRSAVGLALDWHGNTKKFDLTTSMKISDAKDALDEVRTDVKALLLAYFQIVMILCNTNRVPVVLGSDRQSIFKFPANMLDPPYVDGMRQRNATNFDALNQLFLRTDPTTYITSPHFKQYITSGKLPFARDPPIAADPVTAQGHPYVLAKYPIFRLHWLFDRYDRFVGYYSEYLATQLTEVNSALQAVQTILAEIACEENDNITRRNPHPFYDQRRAFASQPINSGIIKLRASVTLFMNKAYHLIQDYCEGLRGLPQEAFQSQAAFDCGLEEAYACFIAALMAENQIIYPTGYKSLSSQRNILSHTGNEMARLKRFTFARRSDGHYDITNTTTTTSAGQPPQRKTLSQRYGQW